MTHYRITKQAEEDLEAIWLYIAEDNPSVADRVLDTFQEKFRLLGKHPQMGRSRKDLGETLRSLPVEKYVVIYRYRDECVEIIHVIHGARDIPSLL